MSSREAPALPPALMTVKGLASLLRTSKKAIYARHARGGIPGGVRLGRTLRFDPRVIAQWLSAVATHLRHRNLQTASRYIDRRGATTRALQALES